MHTHLLILFFLLSTTATWAQTSLKDYLVTMTGDTVRGRI